MPKCPKDCHKPNPLIFRRVIIPSALGDDKENPPENGAYCNALVIYEANNAMYLYSSDGIPTKIPTSITSYNDLTDKPSINGVELEGDISLEELGISDLIEESVASEATARAEADESLQDAIDAEEAARIAADRDIIDSIPTVNDATLTIQRNGTSIGTFTANSASDATINVDVPIYTSGLINDSGYVTEAALSEYATDQDIEDAVSAEASIRADADRDLQSQIDAISSASDVVDVVGTYAELQNYDTSKLGDNDIIKVLTDSTHDNAISYYRWDDANDTFVYIGSQGPFYTKSETDATFVPQTRTVNGKALSTDIILTASDVSALPASTVIPTVNNATLTIKKNGNNIASFTANSATDVSADITVPTKTSDLTNDSDFVSDASYVHTDNNFTTAEKNKLAGIAAGAEVNVQSDWNQTNSSADDFIKNKPAIPTKTSDLTNDSGFISSLPIASASALGAIKVGTNLSIAADGTLSADAQSITVDSALSSTSTNPVENRVINAALGTKANTADLAEVATSGDYDDLLNKPTIPTVNNATLTIQRNGTTVDTFTANASQDKSVNIVVPTATSDLTNDSGFLTSIPTASASTLGGIKVGAGLSITDGVLSTTGGGVADAVEWTNVLNRPTNVSYWTNDAGYITSAALPTKTSDLTNDGSDGTSTYVEADDLATVATSGSYNDLSNKPTIPTVNDATITIQRNSATVDSFTVNASQNKSINIVVPTKTSDLTNDSNFATTAQIPTKTSDLTNDGSDGTSTYVEADDLATVATSGSYTDLSNRPTIGNATLTIQKNGTNVQTFTANATSNKTANITVPTKTSDLTNDSNFVSNTDYATASTGGVVKVGSGLEITNGVLSATGGGTADAVEWDNVLNKPTFSTVATSGSYNDLTNKPTIPTVNNATLTIQRNSTSVGTFTANASSNKTINITVPTTAADVSALPASTKYGASITVSLNTTDYKMTTTLKDQDGNTLGTAQTIDLPLESVVVNGSYDSTNKKIVLTLQSGSTIDIPVGDLIAGLQSEITSTNKLASDLVDDTNQTHKFMTSAEKTKLSGIAAGAEVNVQANWTQTTTTADDYIKNKPTLATVATSGSYNDLSNKPTIPTVNNATLTIQKNGTTVNTFTANASSNVTANITVPTNTNELTNGAGFITSSGTAAKANQLTTARTIAISGGVTGTATSFDGSGNISIPVTYVRDAYTVWGGKDLVSDISPDDAGCTDEFGHNKLAFLPAECIEVKYSTDGGTTWTDYGLTDAQKIAMVTTTGPGVGAGKNATINASNIANMRGRVRIACGTMAKSGKIYTALKKILINFSTNGATNTKIRIRKRTIANYLSGTETWEDLGTHNIGGWSGWNSYPYSGNFGGNMTSQTGQPGQIEFEFWGETFNSRYNSRCSLIDIRFIGTTNWTMPSELARAGHLYTMDTSQNATFPANVNITGSLGHGDYTYTLPSKTGTVAMTSDIPTVNNATLTIQKNSTNVATFTANASSNVTANISVPTATSDLTNDSGFITNITKITNAEIDAIMGVS